jgi:simple sugar transport system substrate-binding protein
MVEQVPFINREAELAHVAACVEAWGTRRVLCIQAEGGVGKTRLLQEIRERHLRAVPSVLSDRVERKDVTLAAVHEFTVTEWRNMAQELGVKLIEADAGFDLDQMAADLKRVTLASPDALVIRLGTDERLRPGIQQALEKGIKVLTLDNYLPRLEGLTTRITLDYYEGARLSLEQMVKEINFQGEIAAFWVKDVAMQEGRKNILDSILLKYPDIELVAEFGVMGADIATVVYNKTQDILDDHPNLRAIWVTWDEFTRGVVQALIDKNRADVLVHSFDLSPSDVDLMLQPASPWRATVAINPTETGRIVVRLATLAAYGVEIERHYSVPMLFITQETLRQVNAGKHPLWSESDIGRAPLLRFLQARAQPAHERHLASTEIVDFDDRALHFPQNLARKIAHMLDEKAFTPYMQGLLDWRRMETAGVSPERLAQERRGLTQTFADCFNNVSERRRVVLSFDTTDALEEEGDVWNDVLEIVPQLENSVVLIAGRNSAKIGALLETEIKNDVQIVKLPPLPQAASKEYLRQKQELLHVTLEPELAEKLLFLAAGRPILIDLALEWLTREIPLDWLVKSSLEEIKSLPVEQLKGRQEEFERQLVRHIADTRRPMDWLTLVMSHIYPLDVEMIPELLGMSDKEAQVLFDEAQSYIFVKRLPDDHISLHDEMRRLVTDYVWPEVDPDGERRRRDSRFATAYFEHKVEALREEIDQRKGTDLDQGAVTQELADLERSYWITQIARVRYALHADWSDGFEVFAQAFDEATHRKQSDARDMLLNLARDNMQRATKQKWHDRDARYKYEIRLARQRLDKLELEQGRRILEALKADYPEQDRQVDVLTRLARCAQLSGDLQTAVRHLEQALQICELRPEMMSAWGGVILNTLGWMRRLMGKWEQAAED